MRLPLLLVVALVEAKKKAAPLPPEPEPALAWQFAVAVVCVLVLIMLFPALKRKLRTFDGALEVSALSHQMWTCNLVLQYWIGHTKILPAAVDVLMLPCGVQHALGAVLATKAVLYKEEFRARYAFALINALYFIGGPIVTEGLHWWGIMTLTLTLTLILTLTLTLTRWGFITLTLGYEHGRQYLVPWQFPINHLLYIPSILSDISLVFYTSREVKQD